MQHIHYHNGNEGADAAAGLPASSQLIPGIVDWLETDEGKAVDGALRKQLKRLTFRFDKFVGHSIHASDRFFCDMVRSNRHAEITLIDRDLDVVSRNLCNTLQLSPNRYTTQTVQGYPARKYDNRITVVQADLSDIDLTPWLEDPDNKSLKGV